MKTAKLTNIKTTEAAELTRVLGGSVVAYRDVPLFSKPQICDLVEEMRGNTANALLFDTGALFDRAAYGLARDAVVALAEKFPDRFKVVIYNTPGYK